MYRINIFIIISTYTSLRDTFFYFVRHHLAMSAAIITRIIQATHKKVTAISEGESVTIIT